MKSKYMAVIPFLFAFGVLLISGCSITTQKSTSIVVQLSRQKTKLFIMN